MIFMTIFINDVGKISYELMMIGMLLKCDFTIIMLFLEMIKMLSRNFCKYFFFLEKKKKKGVKTKIENVSFFHWL